MSELPIQHRLLDPSFRRAVELMDNGDLGTLRAHLEANPALLSARGDYEGDSDDQYFHRSYLIWFIAENPIRTGSMLVNVVAVASLLIELGCKQLDYTLSLVVSGRIARQQGQQRRLVEVLSAAGADPQGALRAPLGESELEAAQYLLDVGAELTLEAAASLDRLPELVDLFPLSSDESRAFALAAAAVNGKAEAVRRLLELGAEPNAFNPEGAHAHCTPLHNAVNSASVGTVRALVEGGGSLEASDRIWNATPESWARHLGYSEIETYLKACR